MEISIYFTFISENFSPDSNDPLSQKSGREYESSPLFTFQLFIYESLSIRYHYPIKRTRDV